MFSQIYTFENRWSKLKWYSFSRLFAFINITPIFQCVLTLSQVPVAVCHLYQWTEGIKWWKQKTTAFPGIWYFNRDIFKHSVFILTNCLEQEWWGEEVRLFSFDFQLVTAQTASFTPLDQVLSSQPFWFTECPAWKLNRLVATSYCFIRICVFVHVCKLPVYMYSRINNFPIYWKTYLFFRTIRKHIIPCIMQAFVIYPS